ncbi:conserved hypothetical protein [Paenibacillus curdlanolyticus YK9]|uniref:Condensation domain protein n=1 Tax=Paenibacillus curdlanolyticus YK9 TaxID=717606 RepID=E0I4N2_9BACL|nr:hypothetical protein [Paenibacillus curdlanolyticus]EFM12563.1 conserved hypothetical protein [Paenibacillus curdlanolyticus YK9]
MSEVQIPDQFPTAGQDWANYVAGYDTIDTPLKAVLTFDGHLDAELISRAVRLSIDAEPVLGCRFVEHPKQPSWERFESIDDRTWCRIEVTDDHQAALQQFMQGNPEPKEQLVHVLVIRTEQHDTLCVVLDHAYCDASGVKEYLQLVSRIYGELCKDSGYVPEVNASGTRDASDVFRALGYPNAASAVRGQAPASKPTWAFPYVRESANEQLRVGMRRLSQAEFKQLRSYGKEHRATVNDLLLAVFYRAMFAFVAPKAYEPMEVTTAVNLRRYLPNEQAASICNLSGIETVKLARMAGEPFVATLRRAVQGMNQIKQGTPGIQNAAAMEMLRNMDYKDVNMFLRGARQRLVAGGMATPLFSNFGLVADHPFTFGDRAVADAYFISSAAYPPGLIFGFSSYNQVLTLTISFYEPAIRKEDVEAFLDLCMQELAFCTKENVHS